MFNGTATADPAAPAAAIAVTSKALYGE